MRSFLFYLEEIGSSCSREIAMRLFLAIQLNEDMKTVLTEMQANLRRQGVRGNRTRRENLHLTLAFLGEYNDPDAVMDAVGAVPFRPFPISLNGFGRFGALYWAGLAPSQELENYVRRLRRALADSGIPFDRKRFSPHITVLRRAVCEGGIPCLAVPEEGMMVTRISLMRSDRGKSGMVYTEIGAVGEEDPAADAAFSGKRDIKGKSP